LGLNELELPLIGLGFANNREEIQDMINKIDVNGNGKIEFDEFLQIIKNNGSEEGNEGLR